MTMIAPAPAPVTPDALGAALHAALLAEARAAVDAVLAVSPTLPEEAATVIDAATGCGLDDVTLSVLAGVLTA